MDRFPAGNRFVFSDSEDDALLSLSPSGSPKVSPTSPHSAAPPVPSRGDRTPDIPRVHLRSSSNLLATPDKAFARARESSSLQQLFMLLSVEHVLLLVRVLLLEHSVLFVSSQFSLLTAVMEALKDLL